MDRSLEMESLANDDYQGVKIVDEETGEILWEMRVLRGLDRQELAVAVYDQFGMDPDEVGDDITMALKDIKRELGEDDNPFRVK